MSNPIGISSSQVGAASQVKQRDDKLVSPDLVRRQAALKLAQYLSDDGADGKSASGSDAARSSKARVQAAWSLLAAVAGSAFLGALANDAVIPLIATLRPEAWDVLNSYAREVNGDEIRRVDLAPLVSHPASLWTGLDALKGLEAIHVPVLLEKGAVDLRGMQVLQSKPRVELAIGRQAQIGVLIPKGVRVTGRLFGPGKDSHLCIVSPCGADGKPEGPPLELEVHPH